MKNATPLPLDSGVRSFGGFPIKGPIFLSILSFFRFPADEIRSEKAKLFWLVRLRWIAILLSFVLSGPALVSGFLSRETMPIYIGLLGILFIFNLLTQFMVSERKQEISPLVMCFQLTFDLVILSALLTISGGVQNPFISLFLLNVSLGGVLIQGRLSWPFLILAHTLLAILQIQYLWMESVFTETATLVSMLTFHGLVFGFWLVMRSLGAYLESHSERVSLTRVAFERQDRLRAIGALSAGFSHEFASPLNAAKISLERLARSQKSEDLITALSALRSCENVIQRMNASQLDSREHRFRDVQLADLIRDITDSWKEDKEEVRLTLDLDEEVRVAIPPVGFAQAFLNLLDNAFEANLEGAIRVKLVHTLNEVVLEVQDEGSGFSDYVLKRRGEPFVTTKKSGTGLGLYVSELFVQSLGGRLEIENRVGEPSGAQVRFCWLLKGRSV